MLRMETTEETPIFDQLLSEGPQRGAADLMLRDPVTPMTLDPWFPEADEDVEDYEDDFQPEPATDATVLSLRQAFDAQRDIAAALRQVR